MKKVIALIIVLGLPLVVTPAGAESGLSKVKCDEIVDHYNSLSSLIKGLSQQILKDALVALNSSNPRHRNWELVKMMTETVKKYDQKKTDLATQYQAFCKP